MYSSSSINLQHASHVCGSSNAVDSLRLVGPDSTLLANSFMLVWSSLHASSDSCATHIIELDRGPGIFCRLAQYPTSSIFVYNSSGKPIFIVTEKYLFNVSYLANLYATRPVAAIPRMMKVISRSFWSSEGT